MISPTELLAHAKMMSEKMKQCQQSWVDEISTFRNRLHAVESEYRTRLKRDAWASQKAVSEALYRLYAIEEVLAERDYALSMRGFQTSTISIKAFIKSKMAQRPLGCENGAWQLIDAVAEADECISHSESRLQESEKQLQETLDDVRCTAHGVLEMLTSSTGQAFMKILQELHDIENKLRNSSRPKDKVRWQLEDRRDRLRRILKGAGNVPVSILELGAILSQVGIKMPRQTLITEYFSPLGGLESDEDNEDQSVASGIADDNLG